MRWKLFLTKIFHWEFWPFHIVYFPLALYWLWLSVKARSFFYFAAANPSIETGGMLGESKSEILKKIPEKYIPKTIYIKAPEVLSAVKQELINNALTYPVIVKPDIGERGKLVEKITSDEELERYLKKIKVNFLIQEFIDWKVELGVFYYRHPDWENGIVSSIVIKDYLKVTGDGKSTIFELMARYSRAAFQLKRLSESNQQIMRAIPAENETVELEPIGNHCRGTTFLNGNHLIDEKLTEVFDRISKAVEGFYYGRYDLKCRSIEGLKKGETIKIVELNGVGAEPAHIYQPGFPILEAYKVLFTHWRHMYEISCKNRKRGCAYMNFKEGWQKFKWIKEYNKRLA